MSSGTLLLKGRYFGKALKLGIATGVACTVSGIGTYLLVRKRINDSEEYIKSINDDFHKTNDDRIMKFAGYNRDKRFPHVPFLDNSEGAFDDYYKKYNKVDVMLLLEKEVLSLTEDDKYFAQLFLTGIRKDWIKNEDQKILNHKRLEEARGKAFEKFVPYLELLKEKEDILRVPKEDKLLCIYFLEYIRQAQAGLQTLQMPLAVKYLPKPPSE